MKHKVYVVIPNLNGAQELPRSVDAVLAQSLRDFKLVIVDNGSTDQSRHIIEAYKKKDPRVAAIYRNKNYGYTGGMNPGLKMAIQDGADYAAGCNNDAKPHKDWLKYLVQFLDANKAYGTAACALLHADGKTYDSTADEYTIWGLPYPRGRGEPVKGQYDHNTDVFGASGGASLYRVAMLKEVGLFDQDFFAYYEDIDLSFRAQLAGWKVGFVPQAIVYHKQGATTNRLPSGFTTYQTMKNLPLVLVKDVPGGIFWRVAPRLLLAHILFGLSAVARGQGGAALKGWFVGLLLLPKKIIERGRIQRGRKVKPTYIWSKMLPDLPPNAAKLRALRAWWWKLIGRKAAQK